MFLNSRWKIDDDSHAFGKALWFAENEASYINKPVYKKEPVAPTKYPKHPTATCPHIELVSYWSDPADSDWTFQTEFMRLAEERKNRRMRLKSNADKLYQYYNTDEQ